MGLLTKDRDTRIQTAKEVVQTIENLERAPALPPSNDEVEPAETMITETQPLSPSGSSVSSKALKSRERAPSASAVKRKANKKAQFSERKKKRSESVWTASRIILVTSIVLFSIALVIFMIGIIRRSNRPQTSLPPRLATLEAGLLPAGPEGHIIFPENWGR
jgi:hypothetical protein